MRKYFLISLLLFMPFTHAYADLAKGMDAAKSGDYETALKEWKPLAEQGDAMARRFLGQLYLKGLGVTQDTNTALRWYKLAADQGDANAQSKLARIYYDGKLVPQDYATAFNLYKLAAEQGLVVAQHNLGWMYSEGYSVPQDYVRAHMWMNLAASLGHKNAVTTRNRIEEKMTPADVSKAQKLARNCVTNNYKNC